MKKALVVSGGGSWGAWGGGAIEALKKDQGKDYDLYVATSTGSLLCPLASQNNFLKLREAYTAVTQESIFDVNPFTKKGGVNFLNAIWRVIRGKKTLGESKNLRDRINVFFPETDFNTLKNSMSEVVVTVVNTTTENIEYKSSKDCNYTDFCDWVWASACSPVFMTLVEKEGCQYIDGGIMEHIPIQYAIEQGATEIDVIIHRTQTNIIDSQNKIKNVFDHFMKVIKIMHRELSTDDVAISKLQAKDKEVKLNLYYIPYKLNSNSLLFDAKLMNEWWDLGKGNTVSQEFCKKITLKKKKK